MLAGRRFSDWVPCVDPAIGAFMRGYNDNVSDELRQDLYRYAARVLDSWVDLDLAERRAAMCRTWARQAQLVRRIRFPWSLRFRPQARFEFADCEFAGVYAARFARRDRAWHTWTLGFVDALCWVGRSDQDDEVLPPAPPDASSLSVAPEKSRPHRSEGARHAEEVAA